MRNILHCDMNNFYATFLFDEENGKWFVEAKT